MKAHIGADAESGLVHTVRGTSGNVGDVTEGNSLLHGQEAIFDAVGLEKPNIELLDEAFLAQVKNLPERNLRRRIVGAPAGR